MKSIEYVKASMIQAYANITTLIESEQFDFLNDALLNVWMLSIYNSVNSMCQSVLVKKGYEYNSKMRFQYEDGYEALSAIDLIYDTQGIMPDFINQTIDVFNKMFSWVNTVASLEDEFEIYPLLELYDKFCIWFWENTNIREDLSIDDSEEFKEVVCLVMPHIKGVDSVEEYAMKESIVGNNERNFDAKKIELQIRKILDGVKEIHQEHKVLNEKIDSMNQILEKLVNQISSYQELVQSQIELAVTEDEIDRIVHAYSEECVCKIIKEIDGKYSDISRSNEEKKLIASLGRELWEKKLTAASKNYLISSKVTYNYYLSIETLDYSGVCLLVTKALEVEMSERFYREYVAFLKTGYTDSWKRHLDDFPTTLLKTVNGNKVLKSSKDFTLGSVAYVLCAKEDRDATEKQLKNNEKRLVEFAKEKLMQDKSDEEILSTLKKYGEKVADITEEYRNKAAHTNELGRVDAETCFKIVLDTEQLLRVMLDSFNH